MMDMTSVQKRKNLLGGEEIPQEKESPQKVSLTVEGFLTKMGIEWEKRGKATYVYPDSLPQVKEILEKIPNPGENEYIIIPLGNNQGYSVFIMVTRRATSLRISYGRNSIPFATSLVSIVSKLEKVAKEIGLDTKKSGKNLLE